MINICTVVGRKTFCNCQSCFVSCWYVILQSKIRRNVASSSKEFTRAGGDWKNPAVPLDAGERCSRLDVTLRILSLPKYRTREYHNVSGCQRYLVRGLASLERVLRMDETPQR